MIIYMSHPNIEKDSDAKEAVIKIGLSFQPSVTSRLRRAETKNFLLKN